MLISLLFSLISLLPSDSLQTFVRPLSEAEILCIEAEDQHRDFEFSAALESYGKALAGTTDSLRRIEIDSLMTICRNGKAMAGFCYRPKVAVRKRFAASEFLDYYPITASQRRRLSEHPVDSLMLADSTRFAAFFPLESDGYIYFSSRRLFGVGGSDLYRTRRIPGTPFVDEPENLGFPYSSPADDFLLFNTPDGNFTIFASNRGCSPDSVYLYVLAREAVPVSTAVAEGKALKTLCALEPRSSAPVSIAQKQALAAYEKASGENSMLQDSLARHNQELDAMRRRYTGASGAEKQFLGAEISRMEMALPALRKKEAAAAARLGAAEAECRRQGLQPEASVPVWKFTKAK